MTRPGNFTVIRSMTDKHAKTSAATTSLSAASGTGGTVPSGKSESKDYLLCSEEKERHDQCFHRWLHEKFLKGEAKQDDCAPMWTQYEECIKKKLDVLNLTHLKSHTSDNTK